MTHIIEVEDYEFKQIQNSKKWTIVRPKREIKIDDTVVFENDTQQHTTIITNVQTEPGLMKGYVLLTL